MATTITMRYEYHAEVLEKDIRAEWPLFETARKGKTITTEAHAGQVREAARLLGIRDDSYEIAEVR